MPSWEGMLGISPAVTTGLLHSVSILVRWAVLDTMELVLVTGFLR